MLDRSTIRAIVHPDTTVKYFFQDLNGIPLENYVIREVTLTGAVFDDAGDLTNPDTVTVTPCEKGDIIHLSVTDKGSSAAVTDEYTVDYTEAADAEAQRLEQTGKGRKDIIKNTRKGGIEINLHPWNNTAEPDRALAGGKFQLTKADGTVINTYTSDAGGTVTVLYGLEPGEYILTQTVSPTGYIGIAEPVRFRVIEDENHLFSVAVSSTNDAGLDAKDDDPADGKNWVEYTTEHEVLLGIIDIYNKPYTLRVMKMKSGTEDTPLPGAEFALYRAVMLYNTLEKDFNPLPGYESLITGSDGVIPKIDNHLIPRQYYLTELHPPAGYTGLSEDLIITVGNLGNISIESDAQTGILKRVDSADMSSVTYIINVPNVLGKHDYYFDIEKIIFADKNIHDEDPAQKFVFKVERFTESDLEMHAPAECFYVTLNCTESCAQYPYDDKAVLQSFPGHRYHSDNRTVTIAYGNEGDPGYTFPAAILRGRQTVRVSTQGIYRVTEVSGWSSTDYDFWTGSNLYAGYAGGGEPVHQSVKIHVTDQNADYGKDSTLTDRPTASFTNTETEYAYLSDQAYAENRIAAAKETS